ncbi:MAG TPA: helix-turn-helix domain-containing protein [Actinoplanes sp.]|nr:helix-turn-helix domain-containing protein [Actinoplanes sp.]
MTRQKLSQQTLADRIGWTQPRLSRHVTTGKTWVPFTVVELAEVAAGLGKPMSAFLPPELAALSA